MCKQEVMLGTDKIYNVIILYETFVRHMKFTNQITGSKMVVMTLNRLL